MKKLTLFVFVLLFSIPMMAETFLKKSEAPNISQNADGVAINGYDPVAFFTEQKAVKGSSVYTCQWNDVTWHFSSEENRDLFLENPKDYAPEYGGYCAHAIGKDRLVQSDPQSFVIKDDKLYLFKDEKSKKKGIFNFNKTSQKRDKNWLKFTTRF